MAVRFDISGGTKTFLDNTTLLQLNDGRRLQADALSLGDVYVDNGEWVRVNSVPVVT